MSIGVEVDQNSVVAYKIYSSLAWVLFGEELIYLGLDGSHMRVLAKHDECVAALYILLEQVEVADLLSLVYVDNSRLLIVFKCQLTAVALLLDELLLQFLLSLGDELQVKVYRHAAGIQLE